MSALKMDLIHTPREKEGEIQRVAFAIQVDWDEAEERDVGGWEPTSLGVAYH